MKKISREKTIKGKELLAEASNAIESSKKIEPELKIVFQTLIEFSSGLLNHLSLNSSNSSLPPSQDPNRVRKITKVKGRKRKPGAQKGHVGHYLNQSKKPDFVEQFLVDQSNLPAGEYVRVGFQIRQVFDIEFKLVVTEYQAEIIKNKKGVEFVADFPKDITEPVQYGNSVKATSTYMSQSQLIPLNRVRDCFQNQFGFPISKGSIYNFNKLAYDNLDYFEDWAKSELLLSLSNNADETGINIGGKKHWLHCLSNDKITLFHPDEKRGLEAMERMGVLPWYMGNLVHDHWKPYFSYDGCLHSLCNSHHLRELEYAFEEDDQKWARKMQFLLLRIKKETESSGGSLPKKRADKFRKLYVRIITYAEAECPIDDTKRAQSKSRNLLDRLRNYQGETLRFMEDRNVPFTNNRAENDQRMTKVQQKISGCFRSMDGAKIFCRIRSYLLTCQKNGVGATEALQLLFDKKLPAFMT